MASNELRKKDELTSVTGDEWVYVQDNLTPFEVKKISITRVRENGIIGKSIRLLNSYIPISASSPWLCMSLSDRILTTSNYSSDFIDEMRSRKVIYDEFDSAVSAFSGSWASNVFTLTNNTANNSMIAELAEDYLFAGSPSTGWRILHDGTNEFNITGISVSARTITVNLDSKTASGTSISIYLNRVYGSTTSCKHFSWAGLGLYMTGQNKITGLRRRDKFQGHEHLLMYTSAAGAATSTWARGNAESTNVYQTTNGRGGTNYGAVTDGTNGTPRTGPKTEMESGTILAYMFVGSYAD